MLTNIAIELKGNVLGIVGDYNWHTAIFKNEDIAKKFYWECHKAKVKCRRISNIVEFQEKE